MSASKDASSVTRRTALIGIGAGSLGVAISTRSVRAAQTVSTADHPLTGVWLAMANPSRPEDPKFAAPSIFSADGTAVLGFVPAGIGMDGNIEYPGSPIGVWEPYDDHTGHFTVVQSMADISGKLIGSVTIDGHPQVSEDGMSFVDTGELNTVTIRDAAGVVVVVIPPNTDGRPITAIKMRAGNAGFPGDELATPIP